MCGFGRPLSAPYIWPLGQAQVEGDLTLWMMGGAERFNMNWVQKVMASNGVNHACCFEVAFTTSGPMVCDLQWSVTFSGL